MSKFRRGYHTSIPTPGMLNHKQAVEASEKLRASYRQGKHEREGESDPSWSDDDDRRSSDQHPAADGHDDELAVELMADEVKRQKLIQKICNRDHRDDHINMDEDELQAIWDVSKAQGKEKASADALFSHGSKIIDHGPAQLAILPKVASKPSNQTNLSRKHESSSLEKQVPAKRLLIQTLEKCAHHQHRPGARNHRSTRARIKTFVACSPTSPSNSSRSAFRSRTASSASSGHPCSLRLGHHYLSRSSSRRESLHASSWASSPSGNSQRHANGSGNADKGRGKAGAEEDLGFDEEPGSDEESRARSRGEKKRSKSNRKSDRGRSGEFEGVERNLVDKTVELLCSTMSIRDQINSFRSRLRNRVKVVFAQQFEFRSRTLKAKAIDRKVQEMLPFEFHHKGSEKGKGWFQHSFVQRIVCEAFFTGRSPIGVKYPEMFNPFPPKAVSLVCTMAMFLLGEWKTGRYVKQCMTLDSLKPLYNKQQRVMVGFCDKQGSWADELFASLYKDSMSDMGASVQTVDEDSTLKEEDLEDIAGGSHGSSGTPPLVAGPSKSAVPEALRSRDVGTPSGTPAVGAARPRIEVVIRAPPNSMIRKKGPSAARSAGKLRVLGSQRQD
ncbi:hypothetical protein BDV93DRAFT_509250 [Ceratobasidium sp. AG-I]|nr:hypothetical protein BDV93DRAFT_509250 [Ceratobasidium sp. AG-I]